MHWKCVSIILALKCKHHIIPDLISNIIIPCLYKYLLAWKNMLRWVDIINHSFKRQPTSYCIASNRLCTSKPLRKFMWEINSSSSYTAAVLLTLNKSRNCTLCGDNFLVWSLQAIAHRLPWSFRRTLYQSLIYQRQNVYQNDSKLEGKMENIKLRNWAEKIKSCSSLDVNKKTVFKKNIYNIPAALLTCIYNKEFNLPSAYIYIYIYI